MNELGWELADEALDVAEQLWELPWWRWRRRRELLGRADELEAEAAEFGLDLAPLFGRAGQLRLGSGAAASEA